MASKAPTPPSGTRDFLPSALVKRKYVINTISSVYETSGFEPLETPAMERLSVLTGKYGEEGDQLIFKVMKRGEKLKRTLARDNVKENELAETGLRYDLTIPLSRVAALYSEELGQIFKRYQIQPVWRADRPAKGRFREFYQCDADILGSTEIIAEIQIFSVINRIMTKLGFEKFELHVNHRQLLSSLLSAYDIPGNLHVKTLIALDKLDKIGTEGVLSELEKIAGINENSLDKLKRLLETGSKISDFSETASFLKEEVKNDDNGLNAVNQISEIFTLSELTSSGKLIFNPLLARGLDYYTGPIFELRLPGLSSSIGGGGRYDKLIGMFAGRDIPAVGFSFGMERIIGIMEEKGMFPDETSTIDLTLGIMNKQYVTHALDLQARISKYGIKTDLFPKVTKPSKIFKWASKKAIRYVGIIGEDEFKNGTISFKDLHSGENKSLSADELITLLKKNKTTTT